MLIPAGEDQPTGLQEVPLHTIVPNPHQPRMPIKEENLAELADSIREHGIIQPLVVTRNEKVATRSSPGSGAGARRNSPGCGRCPSSSRKQPRSKCWKWRSWRTSSGPTSIP